MAFLAQAGWQVSKKIFFSRPHRSTDHRKSYTVFTTPGVLYSEHPVVPVMPPAFQASS